MRRLCAALLVVAACADDAPQPVDVGYHQPGDMDRSGCVAGSLRGLDAIGIWHQDVSLEGYAPFAFAIRIDGERAARLNGVIAETATVSDDDVFLRVAYKLSSGSTRMRAFDFCTRAEDGSLSGPVAFCLDASCTTGQARAVRVERIPGEAEASGLELYSEHRGPDWTDITVNVRVADGVAYLANYHDGLRTVSVRDPRAPVDLGHAPAPEASLGEIYNDVKVFTDGAAGKRYALMASSRRGAVVYDVSDPAAPALVSTFPPVAPAGDHVNVHTLFLETTGGKTLAYLANITSGGLDIYDVSSPAQPAYLGSYVEPAVATDQNAFVHDLYVEDGRAYLAYWDQGLVVVDTQPDPANPQRVGGFDAYQRRTCHSVWVTQLARGKTAVIGDEDFGAHVRLVDVDPASPAFMTQVGELQLRPEVSVHNIQAFGDQAYIAWYQDGLRVLDLADALHPSVAAYYNSWDGRAGDSFYEAAIGIDAQPDVGIIYLADTERGLMILRPTP